MGKFLGIARKSGPQGCNNSNHSPFPSLYLNLKHIISNFHVGAIQQNYLLCCQFLQYEQNRNIYIIFAVIKKEEQNVNVCLYTVACWLVGWLRMPTNFYSRHGTKIAPWFTIDDSVVHRHSTAFIFLHRKISMWWIHKIHALHC